jgi:hypothetical protein
MNERADLTKILDYFVGTFAQDERVLSPSERVLLTDVVAHIRASGHSPELDDPFIADLYGYGCATRIGQREGAIRRVGHPTRICQVYPASTSLRESNLPAACRTNCTSFRAELCFARDPAPPRREMQCCSNTLV